MRGVKGLVRKIRRVARHMVPPPMLRAYRLRLLKRSQPGDARAERHFDQDVRQRLGDRVLSGPFEGLVYRVTNLGSQRVPKLLGTYEQELHDVVAEILASAWPRVINVGVAEGYYLVGIGRALAAAGRPVERLIGFDLNPASPDVVTKLAHDNGIEGIDVQSLCDHRALALLVERDTLVVCDIEGGEEELLDPVAVPALSGASVLVEVHEPLGQQELLGKLTSRFAASHDIRIIEAVPRNLVDWPAAAEDIYPEAWKLRAMNENRKFGNAWLWMTPRLTPVKPGSP